MVIVVRLVLPVGRPEGATGDRRLSDHWRRDDDRLWIGSLIYNSPDDPDVFVPERFGLGWTINVGRPLGKIILIATLLLPPALVLLEALSRGS